MADFIAPVALVFFAFVIWMIIVLNSENGD